MLVTAPLLRSTGKGGERMVKVNKAGKFAETNFRRVKKYKDLTLVEASPKTGRTHQIRVHSAWLGHPIVGDERYGNEAENNKYRQRGFKRLFLHAEQLQFVHPVTQEMMKFKAPLPEELVSLLQKQAVK